MRKPLLLAYAALWPMRCTLSCAKQTARFGRSVRAATGLSLARQFAEQWRLCLRDGCWPLGYYKFRLYLPERRETSRRFVHEHEALEVMRAVNTGPDMEVLDDKLRFAAACQRLGLPHLQTVAYFEDGALVESESPEVATRLPREDLFIKSTNLLCGRGVERWRYVAGDDVYERDGVRLTSAELVEHVRTMSRKGAPTPLWKRVRACIPKLGYEAERGAQQPRPYIVQRRVQNHAALAGVSGGALATVRVVTARAAGGKPEFVVAALRMPAGGSAVDNFAAGGIASPIDPDTGRLGPAVYKDPRKPATDVHPDSGHRITGMTVPLWAESRDLCLRAHELFPQVATVGWDVAITDDGPKLLEANPVWCVELVQMAHGKPLGDTRWPPLTLTHATARP